MALILDSDSTRAYAVLAPAYDLLTAGYAYGPWLTAIERVAREHGLRGHRLLDVGCGTGKSFMPLLERGFDVTACDISPEMVDLAQRKAGARADVHVADMRRLPVFGEFDLITCIDDAVNHLLGAGRGLRRARRHAREPRARRAADLRRQHAGGLPSGT